VVASKLNSRDDCHVCEIEYFGIDEKLSDYNSLKILHKVKEKSRFKQSRDLINIFLKKCESLILLNYSMQYITMILAFNYLFGIQFSIFSNMCW
jgi:hypothetical protein